MRFGSAFKQSFWILLFSVIATGRFALAQGQPVSNDDYQFSVTECEGASNCAVWQFTGAFGTGTWDDGENASLTIHVTKKDEHHFSVSIHRVDTGGKNRGYKADYDGVLVNGQMAGTYTSTHQGRSDEGAWHAVPKADQASMALPGTFRLCEASCVDFHLVDGRYIGLNNTGQAPNGWSDTITVLSFSKDDVTLRRVLTGSIHFTVTYRGQISADGNSVINVRNPFCCKGGQPEFTGIVFHPSGRVSSGRDDNQQGITLDQGLRGAEIIEKAFALLLQYQEQNPSQ